MFDWFWRLVFRKSVERELMVAALGSLVHELGGSVVLTLDQLNAIDPGRIEVVRNENPEGMRIFLREV